MKNKRTEDRKILLQLVDEYGYPKNITDLELLSDVEAYGTFEIEIDQKISFWTFNDRLYRYERK